MMMTKRSIITILALAALTLAGFIVVFNLIGGRRSQSVSGGNVGAKIAPTAPPPVSAPPAAGRSNPAEAQLRTDLSRARTLLNQLNDAVTVADWSAAQRHFAEFGQCTLRLPAPQLNHPDISPMMQDFFALYKVQLSRALAEQNANQARFAANQLFGIVSEQRARMGTRGVPIEFQRIGFLIREIALWKQADDAEMLRVRAASLQDAWKEVRPVIVARRNGMEQARLFDALIEKLDQAQDVSALVSDLSREFEIINNLFQRPSRPQGASAGANKPAEDDD
ncbi:MAG: hypothetical protein ACREEM_49945 [Blastocatellia bacterium]